MKKNGFTLIEFLVGMTMTALVFIVATNLVIAFFKVDSKSQRSQQLEQAKSDLSSEFTNGMQWAKAVEFKNGVLTIDSNKYEISGGKMLKNGVAFTGANVVVSDFSVKRVDVVSTRTNPGTGTGLLGSYFDNNDFTSLKATRIDPQIDFSWGIAPPLPEVSDASYSVRWLGQLEVPQTGQYTFFVQSNSGTRLWVSDTLLFDNWLANGTEGKGTIALTRGKLVSIRAEYYNNLGSSNISLLWAGPGIAKQVIPAQYLYPEESQSGYEVNLNLTHTDSPDTKDAISLFIAPRIQTGQTIINE